MLHGKKIIVVMPAYHAEKTLAACYEAIPHDIVDEVLFVDDADDDATNAVAETARHLHAVRHPSNRGYGGNQKGSPCAAARARAPTSSSCCIPITSMSRSLITAMSSRWSRPDVYDVVIGSRILGNDCASPAACRSTSTSRNGC